MFKLAGALCQQRCPELYLTPQQSKAVSLQNILMQHRRFCFELLSVVVVRHKLHVPASSFSTIAGLRGFNFFHNITMASAASPRVLAGPGAAPGRGPDPDRRPRGHAERGAEGPSQPGQVCTQNTFTRDPCQSTFGQIDDALCRLEQQFPTPGSRTGTGPHRKNN